MYAMALSYAFLLPDEKSAMSSNYEKRDRRQIKMKV